MSHMFEHSGNECFQRHPKLCNMTVLVRRFFSHNGVIGTEHGRSDFNQSCETQDSFVHKGAEVGLDLSTKAVPKEKLTLLRRGL